MLCGSNLRIVQVPDTSSFDDFSCGVDEMDDFIHSGLELSVKNSFCRLYSVIMNDTPVALFALTFDSLYLDQEDKSDLQLLQGCGISTSYSDTFWSKRHYPALEISYLAVTTNMRNKGLGSFLIEEIAQMAIQQKIGGCQFLTVEALSRSSENYSAVGFYNKQNFIACEYPNPTKATRRMFKPIYLQS